MSTTLETRADAPSSLSNSQRLRLKIALVKPEFDAARHALMRHPRLADLYRDYLFLQHCTVRASVPMMRAALARCRELAGADPVAATLADYFEHHIPEELRHDVWVLEDLEVLGVPRAEVLRRLPSPTVAALIGAQYYWINHYHPVALLGYMELAECYPPTVEGTDAFREATGYPRTAFRALYRHARLDPHHAADLHEVLDGLALTPEQQALLGMSAMQSVGLVARALREIVARAPAGEAS